MKPFNFCRKLYKVDIRTAEHSIQAQCFTVLVDVVNGDGRGCGSCRCCGMVDGVVDIFSWRNIENL